MNIGTLFLLWKINSILIIHPLIRKIIFTLLTYKLKKKICLPQKSVAYLTLSSVISKQIAARYYFSLMICHSQSISKFNTWSIHKTKYFLLFFIERPCIKNSCCQPWTGEAHCTSKLSTSLFCYFFLDKSKMIHFCLINVYWWGQSSPPFFYSQNSINQYRKKIQLYFS